jgi:hypothetical protein
MFFLSGVWYHHHTYLFVIALCIVGFSVCYEHYSFDAWVTPTREIPHRIILPLRLLQVQLTVLYVGTFVNKLNEGWFSGAVIRSLYDAGSIHGPLGDWLMAFLGSQVLSLVLVACMGTIALTLWSRRYKRVALYLGVLLHLGIDATMNVGAYSYIVLVLYIAFVDPRIRRTAVIYDTRCLLCTRAIRTVRYLDWFSRVRHVDMYDREQIEWQREKPTIRSLQCR